MDAINIENISSLDDDQLWVLSSEITGAVKLVKENDDILVWLEISLAEKKELISQSWLDEVTQKNLDTYISTLEKKLQLEKVRLSKQQKSLTELQVSLNRSTRRK